MKKTILLLFVLFNISVANAAVKVAVESAETFSTIKPKVYLIVKIPQETILKDTFLLEGGSFVKGRILEVVQPKRAKRNAYFIFQPIAYTIPSQNQKVVKIRDYEFQAKAVAYKPMDIADTAVKTGVSVAGWFLPGVSQAFWFSKGVATSEYDQNRLVSGAKSLYENSPLVYIEEGEELIIHKGDLILFKFYPVHSPKWKVWQKI